VDIPAAKLRLEHAAFKNGMPFKSCSKVRSKVRLKVRNGADQVLQRGTEEESRKAEEATGSG
jgi:hypothetical protein